MESVCHVLSAVLGENKWSSGGFLFLFVCLFYIEPFNLSGVNLMNGER